MNWSIRKGDFSVYTLKILSSGVKQPPDKFGKSRYHYQVQNIISGELVTYDASEVVHKQLATYRIGECCECYYKDIGEGKVKFMTEPFSDKPVAPTKPTQPPATKYPATKDERIEAMYKDKTENILVSLAIKLAVQSFSEKDKERTWSEIAVLLPERERYFYKRLEGDLKREIEDERMNPENKPGFIDSLKADQ